MGEVTHNLIPIGVHTNNELKYLANCFTLTTFSSCSCIGRRYGTDRHAIAGCLVELVIQKLHCGFGIYNFKTLMDKGT